MRLLRRLIRFAQAVVRTGVALAVLLALVLVVPYLLVRYVGNPLPNAVPTWDEVVLSLQSRQLDDSLVIQALAVVVWVVWAHLLLSLIVEVRAAARGVKTSAVRGLGATQWLARRLVAQFTLATTIFVQANVGLTLPVTPALADVVPAVIEESVGGDTPTVDVAPSGVAIEVQTSDTLWDLAEQHLGDGARWTEIRDANVGRTMADGTVLDPNFVTISGNWSLLVPGDEGTQAALPASAGDTVIGAWRVEPGDHFWKMAETVLEEGWGRPASETEVRGYWLDIIAHNRQHLISPGNDPNVIYADQSFEILLPPLPSHGLSADDGLATTMLRPLTGIPQFQPSGNAPPPTHRVTPDAESTDGSPADKTVEVEGGDGPVVELAEGASVPAPGSPVTATDSEAEAATGGRDGGLSLPGRGAQTLAVAGVGLTGVAAALILNSLRARRRYQASRRRPGSIPELPDQEHQQFEARVRSIADHEALRWLAATNKFLTHTLDGGESWHLPPIVAVRAGDHGLEVLLDEDAPAPRGFMDGNQPRSWILDPDIEVRQLEGEAANRLPYAPLLLPVGGTGGGDLLLEIAQFGVIGLEGPAEAITGWLRALTVAVATSSWSENVDVVAIGVDPILARMPHVKVPADPIDWARQENEMRLGEGPRSDSRYETRLRGQRVDETLVLVGPGHEGVAQHLVEAAELTNTPFTLVAAAPVRCEGRIQFEGDRATLEPTGVTFWPSVMEAEAIAMTTTLLDQSADTGSVPVDVNYADEVPGVSLVDGPETRPNGDLPFRDSVPEAAEAIDDGRDVEWRPTPPMPSAKAEIPTTSVLPESAVAPPSQGVLRHHEEAVDAVEADREPTLFATFEDLADPEAIEELGDDDLAIEVAEEDPANSGELAGSALADDGTREPEQTSVHEKIEAGEAQSADALVPVVAETAEGVTSEGPVAVGRLFEPERSVGPGGGDRVPIPLGESERVANEINEVRCSKPIEVVVLTPTPGVEGTLERLTPKNVSVLAYLAFHRSATSNAVREVFWPSSVNRSTSDNAISLIRRNVGKTDAGLPRLNLASEGRFTVSDEIGCDWTRFRILVERAEEAKRQHAVRDEMALLGAALELIDGPIAADVDPKNWPWLRDDPMVYSRIEAAIVDAAHRLGYLGCEEGLPDVATWAADKGLAVVPEQEALYRIQMSAASLTGDGSTIVSVFRQAQRSAEPHGDGVQPETELLYRRLVGLEQDDHARQEGIG